MYNSSELAQLIGMSERTLRRWCERLEERGIVFSRDATGRREFDDSHVELLRHIKAALEKRGTTLEQAISGALGETKGKIPSSIAPVTRSLEELIPSPASDLHEYCMSNADYDTKCQELTSVWEQMTHLMEGEWIRIILFQHNPTNAQQVIVGKWNECMKQMESILHSTVASR